MVAVGRYKHSGYEDAGPSGRVIRSLADARVLARWAGGRWSRPTREAREAYRAVRVHVSGPAVTVTLTKGEFY